MISPVARIQLHFPITCQDESCDPFGGSNVDSLDIGPIEYFESLVRSNFFEHVRKGNAGYFSVPFFSGAEPRSTAFLICSSSPVETTIVRGIATSSVSQ
jgi:hypothetical protein